MKNVNLSIRPLMCGGRSRMKVWYGLTVCINSVKYSSRGEHLAVEDREARILNAAADLMAHYGYDKTTMDDIAREAGVSKGAIYLHFRSKADLLIELLMRESIAVYEEVLKRIEADAEVLTLFNLYRYAVIAVLGNPLLKALYTNNRRVLGDALRQLRTMPQFGGMMDMGIEYVRQFQAIGLIRPDADPAVVAAVLMSIRYGLLTMDEFLNTPPPLDQLGTAIGEMLQKSFGTEFGASPEGRELLRRMMTGIQEKLRAMRRVRHEDA